MSRTGLFYESDIAMIEHEVLAGSDIADWRPDDLQMFVIGVHQMAQKVIDKIRGEEN